MNERIEIKSDTEVRVMQHQAHTGPARLVLHNGFMDINGVPTGAWDAEGLAALRDCINCFEATGITPNYDPPSLPFPETMTYDDPGEPVFAPQPSPVVLVAVLAAWLAITVAVAGVIYLMGVGA